jgi:hypothetical protein
MKKLLLFTAILFLFLSSQGLSQFRLKLGPNTGMNFNIATGSDVEETANGFGFFLGGTVDMEFTPTIGLIANMQFYDNRSVSSSSEGTVQGISYTVDASTSLAYFMIEPLFKMSLPGSGFYFVGGPCVGFNIEGSIEANLSSENDQVTFQDGSTKQKQTLRNTLTRFELKIGSGYDFVLSPLVTLAPQLTFGYGITKVVENVESRVLTIQLQAAVKFALI